MDSTLKAFASSLMLHVNTMSTIISRIGLIRYQTRKHFIKHARMRVRAHTHTHTHWLAGK